MASDLKRSIVIADDDIDDRMLIEDAFEENNISSDLFFVEDGEQLLAFLRREGRYTGFNGHPLPKLIILDLNMPKVDGRAALGEIKKDAGLRLIPVVVLTTSKAEEDIKKTYRLGVNSYITKPVSFDRLVKIIQTIDDYWMNIVALPPDDLHQS